LESLWRRVKTTDDTREHLGHFLNMTVDSRQNVTWDVIGTKTINSMHHVLQLDSSDGFGP
jgi:hypothetical protein